MGARKVMAVSDAGPLIHLAQINCLHYLSIFDEIHIPDTVWMETTAYNQPTEDDLALIHNLKRQSISDASFTEFISKMDTFDLHRGENEGLYLCRQNHISLLLTDDLAARKVAHKMNIQPVGSLGIIVRACREGDISRQEAIHTLQMLHEASSLFVTSAIVEAAIKQLP